MISRRVLGLVVGLMTAAVSAEGIPLGSSSPARVLYGSLPLSFEPNLGQVDGQVKFFSRGAGYTLFLTPSESVLVLQSGTGGKTGRGKTGLHVDRSAEVLRIRLTGANREARIVGEEPLPGKSNYFIGNDPMKWHAGVEQFGKVRYADVWPGIDLIYYGNQGKLEYDFVLKPGADPGAIRLRYAGARRLHLDQDGNLVVGTSRGDVVQRKPSVYQELSSGRTKVEGRYVRRGKREVAFRLAAYDRSKAVVLDPVLSWSTYLGGGQDDFIYPIAVDGSGNVYLTGGTQSTDFPTQSPIYGANGGNYDVFVTKIDAAGTSLLYSTYIGSTNYEWGQGIAVDSAGNVYITGETGSTDFPTVNPLQGTCGCVNNFDAFITKIGAAGDTLIYSTFLGGSGYEEGDGIAVDSTGSVYVAGWTSSADFPTVNPIQATYGGGPPETDDAFAAKINAAGTAVVYATYLGGSDEDRGLGIAIDALGDAFVTGSAASTNFPTQDPIQASNAGGSDAFVTEINAAGDAFVYSTYLGGGADDSGRGIAVDGGGNAYVLGTTLSSDFPTKNPLQAVLGGGNDKFVTKIDSAGNHLIYSTYLGGSANEGGGNVLSTPQTFAVDAAGNAYVAFATSSTDLPAVNAVQSSNAGGQDGYIAIINAAGNGLLFATYLGGTAVDGASSVGIDSFGRPYVTGNTTSTDFPTKNPIQAANAGNGDVWVAKIAGPFALSMTPTSGSDSGGAAVTISGVDFQAGATVSIGGVPATDVSIPTASEIDATTPALSPGTLNDVIVTNPDSTTATLPKGFFAEFFDVPPSNPFYSFIAALFRNGITGGCGGGGYCPTSPVRRDQMAVFLLKGKHGSTYVPPPCTGIFPDVECTPTPAFAVDWIEQLFNEAITGGCGSGNYCPGSSVTRSQMAVFLLKAEHGSSYAPPACTGIFPDVECTPTPAFAVDWIEQLFNEAITGGCGGGNYCPGNSVTRGQMAAFLTKTFNLQ